MRKVFVSSTSEDLKPFRQAARDVVLDLGWHPEMMEHFGTDGSAGIVEACRQRVGASDLVLAILAWRRGWVPGPEVGGDGRSITEIEIETAKSLGKPIVTLLANDEWPGKLWETELGARKQVERLRGVDRLAVFFRSEPYETGVVEPLPEFRAKVRQELLRHLRVPTASPELQPVPRYPSEEIRALSEALDEAQLREETVLGEGGDAAEVRREILDLRRKIREGGNVKAGDLLSGRFKLIELLGEGGFATVWKAFDRRERHVVAVKVLHPQLARDGTRLDRFFRGARKMGELSHPGIVRVCEKRLYDGGYHYFVMEYVAGGDLRSAVLEQRLPVERIIPLLREVAAALQFFHNRGEAYVHRDVKPANILLDAFGRPKLSDFDLVRAAGDTTGGTKMGAMMGAFFFAAPECLHAPQDASAISDVYSLAMTAAFCFHGKDLTLDVLRNPDAFFDRLPCPRGVRDALRKGAAWNTSERYQTVTALAEAIERGLMRPIEVEKPRMAARPPRRSVPNWNVALLIPYLEKEVAKLSEDDRADAVLQRVELALPLSVQDLKTLGAVFWALDYFPGRSGLIADIQNAQSLRDHVLASLTDHLPRPPLPLHGDRAWAVIPGGSFSMGSAEGKDHSDEQPAHRVTLSPFRLGINPVTVAEYARFVIGTLDNKAANLPATIVDWYTAYAYATWIGGRLPTEAEWEYAARGGTEHDYTDRDGKETVLEKVGWYSGNARQKPEPVGQLEPNPWGLCDMIGNVWEWVADWYAPYSAESTTNPWGPASGEGRVFRGGSAWNVAGGARASYRFQWNPDWVSLSLGFRVALPPHPLSLRW